MIKQFLYVTPDIVCLKKTVGILTFFLFWFCSLSAQSVTDELLVQRVADRIVATHVVGYMDKATGAFYRDVQDIPQEASVYFKSPTMDWHYSLGVLNMAMLRAAGYFNSPTYMDFVTSQIDYAFATYPFFEKRRGEDSHEPFHFLWKHRELDHCGAEAAAMLDVLQLFPEKPYQDYISKTTEHVMNRQERLPDGTFVRSWPYPNTLWADDLYMGISFLARMGKYSGDRRFVDDAIQQIHNFTHYLWCPQKELYYHAWYDDLKRVGGAHWGRCNGWVMLAMTHLLDVLPTEHPDREEIISLFTRHVLGVSRYQAPSGLWHQLLDKPDSYEESSCSAIFTYCVAKAINKGWMDARYAPIALDGWKGLRTYKLTDEGVLKDVCVGTGIGTNLLYYYNRPVKVDEVHGLGLIIDTGLEIIELKKRL